MEPDLTMYTAVLAVMLPLATVALGLRFWVRTRMTWSVGADDWILLAAHVINIAAGITWLNVKARELDYALYSAEYYAALSTPYLVGIGLYVVAGVLVKVAIAQWFLHLTRPRFQRLAIILPLASYIVFSVTFMATMIFRCGLPVSPDRILDDAAGCAYNTKVVRPFGFTRIALSTLCDVMFAVVPLHMLANARGMGRGSRCSAGALILLAVVGSVVSILRVPPTMQLEFGPDYIPGKDGSKVFFLCLLETAVGVLAISMATLRPLMKVVKDWRAGRSRRTVVVQEQLVLPAVPICLPDLETRGDSQKSADEKGDGRIDSYTIYGMGVLPECTSTKCDTVIDIEENVRLPRAVGPRPVGRLVMGSIAHVIHAAPAATSHGSTTESTGTHSMV